MIIFLLLLLAAELACGQVYLGFPFDQQLPTVGRVDEPYSFTVAANTYLSTDLSVEYSASGLPSWLLFNSTDRTFTGNPSSSNVGTFPVSLIGTDALDGTTISNTYNLIVSNNPGIRLSSPDTMNDQLSAYGNTNGNGGLVLREGQLFEIKFNKDTFVPESEIVAYYGVSSTRAPLPPWITFNADDLSFRGTVPQSSSATAPAISFDFSLIATDYRNYEAATAPFGIVVGKHTLSTSVYKTSVVNGTAGSDFSIQVPILSLVYLDQELITPANISRVSAESLPSYASFDTASYVVSGKFPNATRSDLFNIFIKDVYDNYIPLRYTLNNGGSLFTVDELNAVNATRDEYFQYQLASSLFSSNDHLVAVDTASVPWLSYNQDNMTFTGITPSDFTAASIDITVFSDGLSSELPLTLRGINRQVVASSSSQSSLSPTSTGSTNATATSKTSATNLASSTSTIAPVSKGLLLQKKLGIGLGVGIPGFIIILAALIFLCCLGKKGKSDNDEEANTGVATEKNTFPPVRPHLGSRGAAGAVGAGALAAAGGNHFNSADARSLDQLIPIEDNTWSAEMMAAKDGEEHSSSYSASTAHESVLDADSSEKEVPVISWRADLQDDEAAKLSRQSVATMDTVNTENLFLVRVVDDMLARDSDPLGSPLLGLVSPTNRESDPMTTLDILPEETRSQGSALHAGHSDEEADMSNSDLSERNLLSNLMPTGLNSDLSSIGNTVPPRSVYRATPSQQSFHAMEDYSQLFAYSEDHSFGATALDSGDAKLVEFTRGGSLRTSSHSIPQNILNREHSARLDDDADSS